MRPGPTCMGGAAGVAAGIDSGSGRSDHRGDHHHRHRLDPGLWRYRGRVPAPDPDRVRAVDRVCGVLVLPVVLLLRRRRGGRVSEATSGFEVRSEEHTSELQSLMRISYAVFCLKKKKKKNTEKYNQQTKTAVIQRQHK